MRRERKSRGRPQCKFLDPPLIINENKVGFLDTVENIYI